MMHSTAHTAQPKIPQRIPPLKSPVHSTLEIRGAFLSENHTGYTDYIPRLCATYMLQSSAIILILHTFPIYEKRDAFASLFSYIILIYDLNLSYERKSPERPIIWKSRSPALGVRRL